VNDEKRALRWASAVWRASPPSEREIRIGADRIARRLTGSRSVWRAGKPWAMSVATAALLGVIGYAGRGALFEPARSSTGPGHPSNQVEEERRASDDDHEAPTALGADGVPAAPNRQRDGTDAPTPIGATPQPTDAVPRPSTLHPSAEPTWTDVSEALAVPDHARAEKLLIELAGRGHDANTRAKAHLGLAQLYEGHSNCEAAKQHALRAAAIPDVEIKTVRRALELAARCAR
jgi:hypothetical protein